MKLSLILSGRLPSCSFVPFVVNLGRCLFQQRIDFHSSVRVDFPNHLVLLFHNFFGSRVLVNLTRREAGENPALPRNCKRGNRNRSLG